LRGGSAFSGAVDCRSAARSQCHFDGRYDRNGFRLAWNPWPPERKIAQLGKDEIDDKNEREIKRKKKKDIVIIRR